MEKQLDYPDLATRIKALLIDTFFLILLGYLFAIVYDQFGISNTNIKIATFVFLSVFIDPLCTTFFGGTLGHHIMGIRVKTIWDLNKNVMLPLAIVRYLSKTFLGVISFIVSTADSKGRGIHDYISGSILLYKK